MLENRLNGSTRLTIWSINLVNLRPSDGNLIGCFCVHATFRGFASQLIPICGCFKSAFSYNRRANSILTHTIFLLSMN